MLQLGLWGLVLLILWTYRNGYRLSASLLQITLATMVALSVWFPPAQDTSSVVFELIAPTSQLSLAPRAFSPLILLTILIAHIWGRREEADMPLVTSTVAVGFVGLALPILLWASQLLQGLLGVGLALSVPAGGLRSQFAQAAALIGGIYGQLLLFEIVRRRLGLLPITIVGGVSYLLGGWLHGVLVATGAAFGTGDWVDALGSELLGWTTTVGVLWPLTMVVGSRLGISDELRRGRQPLGESVLELLSLRRALQRSEDLRAGLNERLRRLTTVRTEIVRAESEASLLRSVPELLCQAEDIRACWIGLNQGGQELLAAARCGVGWEESLPIEAVGVSPVAGQELVFSAEGEIEEILANWVVEHPYHRAQQRLGSGGEEIFPLRTGNRLLGALIVYPTVSELGVEDQRLLEGAADDLAYGLYRLRLEEARAKRVRELTAIREVMSEMISQPSVPRLLEVVTQRAVELLDGEAGEIYLVAAGGEELRRVAQHGESTRGDGMPDMEGIAARVAKEGKPTVQKPDRGRGDGEGLVATISAPLTWQGRVTGVINVCRDGGPPIQERELDMLEVFANQAALALENARLLETERKRSSQLERVRQASLSMTSSLELQTVLESILEQALEVVAAYDAHIFLYDGRRLQFAAALWASGDQREPYSEPREHGLTYRVARSGERMVIADARAHPIFADTDWEWNGAIVGLPLKVGPRVLGVMNVAFNEPHEFSREELHVLELLGDQAAVVLENARLFDRTAAERRRLQLLYDVAKEITGSLDPEAILQEAIELTTANLGGLIGGVVMLDRETSEMSLVGLAGLPMERRSEINALIDMRIGVGLVGWVAEKAKPALAVDVSQDPRWEPVSGVDDDVQSALAAPIFVAGEMVGVMAIFHTQAGVFGEEHLELLTAICRQTGLAWSNARRYRQVERRLAEQTALQQVAQVINRRLEMEPLLDAIVEQVSKVLGYPVVDIVLVEGDELVVRAGAGLELRGEKRLTLDEGVVGRVVRTGKPEFVSDVTQDEDYSEYVPGVACEIAVPLHKGDVVVGVLNVEAFEPGALGEEDLRLLMLLADQVSVAVENAALYDRLREHTAELEAVVGERTRELRVALSKAQEADRLKTQFVSDVSHELRTPLSNIQLYVELLRQAGSDRRRNYLQTLERETDRLVALIEDLLSISRLDAGNMPMDFEELDLNELSAALVEDRRRLFSERGLRLHWSPGEVSTVVEADKQLLSRVIANLMTNAMHYTPEGGEIRVLTGGRDARWVTLTVEDNGLGIPEGEMNQLFTRFFRGSASRQMGNAGTGLGLAISMEIVERHGGRITVESQEGVGSRFTVWLPRARGESGEGFGPRLPGAS